MVYARQVNWKKGKKTKVGKGKGKAGKAGQGENQIKIVSGVNLELDVAYISCTLNWTLPTSHAPNRVLSLSLSLSLSFSLGFLPSLLSVDTCVRARVCV